MKRLARFVAALSVAVLLSAGFVACKASSQPSSGTEQVTYKCGCGKTTSLAAGSTAPK